MNKLGLTLSEGIPNFSKTAQASCSTTTICEETNGLYTAEDNDGITYYFRGAVDNNYMYFAGFYWRIIRVNGDGSIRLIYQGTSANATGTSTQTGTSAFNSSSNRSEYAGLMYTESSQYGTNTNSTIYTTLNTWYTTNISGKGYGSYIEMNAGFCGDRDMASGSTWSSQPSSTIHYAAYRRLVTNKSPVFTCSTNNLYTYISSTKGNKSLSSPIGLITADEVAYAGGVDGNSNQSYYLYTGSHYWTMSPSYALSTHSFRVDSSGDFDAPGVSITAGVRPVINLRADVTISSGNGTASTPFVIE